MTAGDGINNLLNPRLRSLREKALAFGSRTHTSAIQSPTALTTG